MKKQKILVVILSILLLLPILILPATAAEQIFGGTARVSADYSVIVWNSQKYIRVSSSDIAYLQNTQSIDDLALEPSEYDHIMYVSADASEYAIGLTLEYNEGGYVNYYYIREDKLDEYNDIITNGADSFSVIGYGYDSLETEVTRSALYSNPTEVSGSYVARYSAVALVEYTAFDGDIELASRGYIFKGENDSFYYVDEYQFGAGAERFEPIAERDTVTIYKITDDELVSVLKQQSGYNDIFLEIEGSVGFFVFSVIIFAIVLGFVPLLAAIASFILGFFARKGYKKFFFTVAGLCLLAAFVTLIAVILCVLFYIL